MSLASGPQVATSLAITAVSAAVGTGGLPPMGRRSTIANRITAASAMRLSNKARRIGKRRTPGAARLALHKGELIRLERADAAATGPLVGRDAPWSIYITQ